MCVWWERNGLEDAGSKTCCSAAVFTARCSEAATAAAVALLPVTGNATASALGTSHAGNRARLLFLGSIGQREGKEAAGGLREQLGRHSICRTLFSSQFVAPTLWGSSHQRAQILRATGSPLPVLCHRGQGIHQHGWQKGHQEIE